MFGDFNIGWNYAWYFPAIYLLLTAVMVIIYGKDFFKRFFRIPGVKFKGKLPIIISITIFSRGIMTYAIFLPLQTDSTWFWIGLIVFTVTIILTIAAIVNFALTPHDRPVVKGMYRMSRHPIQVMAIIMCIGIGMATESWIIIAASALLAVVSYPTLLVQERSCIEAYGSAYGDYMNKTPRWLGLPGKE